MLCVTGVYLGDMTNTIFFLILHLNMSCLSICSSCLCFEPSQPHTQGESVLSQPCTIPVAVTFKHFEGNQ